MTLYKISKQFPDIERYELTCQMRRSSRSVCSSIGEAWRKRRYRAHFISKLSDAEMEAEETRVWLQFGLACGYLTPECTSELDEIKIKYWVS
jgi:four helix bundle protein